MAVDSNAQDGDAYSVVLSNECELPIDLSSPTTTEVCNPLKSQLSLDARLSNQSNINMMVENAVAYSTFIIDNDVEKGVKSEPQCNEQVLMKSLQKQISFDMGGKYMQLLMNHSLMLSKFSTRDRSATEKILDVPKSRKYKRASSFNSRKVVLLFSVFKPYVFGPNRSIQSCSPCSPISKPDIAHSVLQKVGANNGRHGSGDEAVVKDGIRWCWCTDFTYDGYNEMVVMCVSGGW
ncbi:hypothetical protein R6Q57_021326 [Mikania cordata]